MRYDSYQLKIDDIQWNASQYSLIAKGKKIALTKTEYRLFYPLRHGSPLTYVELARIAYNCDTDRQVRIMIDKHVDRIRGKIKNAGLYIYCILGYGYLLLNEDPLMREQDPAMKEQDHNMITI